MNCYKSLSSKLWGSTYVFIRLFDQKYFKIQKLDSVIKTVWQWLWGFLKTVYYYHQHQLDYSNLCASTAGIQKKPPYCTQDNTPDKIRAPSLWELVICALTHLLGVYTGIVSKTIALTWTVVE